MIRSTANQDPVILFVDAEELAQTLGPRCGRQVLRVPNYLHAIGQLGRRPVSAIIGSLRGMAGSIDQTLPALRQVAGRTPVYLVADAEQEPLAMRAVRLGAEDYFIKPVAEEKILSALGLAGAPAQACCETTRTNQTTSGLGGASTAPHAANDPPASLNLDDDLPDPRLIQWLMTQPGGFEAELARLVGQRLGIAKSSISPEPISGAICQPIEFQNQRLGYLCCTGAARDAVERQARHLGPWVALHHHLSLLHEQAFKDELTGAWNRRYFDFFLDSILKRAKHERFNVTLMLYDIDNFKKYNDTYGHQAGDEILKQAARLMMSLVRKDDVVARVGGDEFAVIFWDAEQPRKDHSEHPTSIRQIAGRFQKAVCDHKFPRLADRSIGSLSVSGGLAGFPWDGQTPSQLYELADRMLLESKKQGKNALNFGAGAERNCGHEQGA